MKRAGALFVLLLCLGACSARRADAAAFVRVLSQNARVRTAPGPQYRVVYIAERGQVLEVVERATKGYWFRVELDDGTTGWVFGEQVVPFEVVEGEPGFFTRAWTATQKAIIGPSPVPYANVELSFSAGLFDREGMFLFRPAWLIDSYFALEGFFGESPRKQETVLLGGLGWTLRLIPGAAIGPYVSAGVGLAHFVPKQDAFTLPTRTLYALTAGGGFEITVKPRITVRVDFRNWTLFYTNESQTAQEYSGGLAIFF